MKTSKFLSVLMAVCMVAGLLAGCGAPAEEPSGAGNDNTSAPVSGAESGGEEGAVEDCALTMLHFTGEESGRRALANMIEGFNSHYPNVSIELEYGPYAEMAQLLATRLAAGDAPDIYESDILLIDPFVEAGECVDMTDWEWVGNFEEKYLAQMKRNDRVYCSAAVAGGQGVIYNKRLFKEAGCEVPETLDEFLAVCQKLKDKGIEPLASFYKQQNGPAMNVVSYYVPAVAATDPTELDKLKSNEITWAQTVGMRKAIESFSKVLDYVNPSDFGTDATTAMTKLGMGDAAMIIVGCFVMPDVRSASDGTEEWGFFPCAWSNNPEENNIYVSLGDSWLVSTQTEYPNACKAFMNYFNSPEGQSLFVNTNGTSMSLCRGVEMTNADPVLAEEMEYINAGKTVLSDVIGGEFQGEQQQVFITFMQYLASLSPEERANTDEVLKYFDAEWATIQP